MGQSGTGPQECVVLIPQRHTDRVPIPGPPDSTPRRRQRCELAQSQVHRIVGTLPCQSKQEFHHFCGTFSRSDLATFVGKIARFQLHQRMVERGRKHTGVVDSLWAAHTERCGRFYRWLVIFWWTF
ncbi:uncharacterized protein YALI1_B16572g [Yarrowia lipolytica]|uniref:Uncharacterized protein n=1 Tax=Yarrowia lipolytica TaxID=4952 RepID=A0A1D8N7J3_YARLL|nr:hypothetical protein YALI1_B16572g [Yarrowia lipolytica]